MTAIVPVDADRWEIAIKKERKIRNRKRKASWLVKRGRGRNRQTDRLAEMWGREYLL